MTVGGVSIVELLPWVLGGALILALTAYGAGLGRPSPRISKGRGKSRPLRSPSEGLHHQSLQAGEGRPWLAAAAASHPGLQRPENQDRFFLGVHPEGRLVVAAVFDGMGGHEGGCDASALAVESVEALLRMDLEVSWEKRYHALQETLRRAHRSIRAQARKRRLRGMGSTAVVALVSDTRRCLHVYTGDSRLYHLRQDQVLYHTRDHSSVQDLLSAGEEVGDEPVASQLTAGLGGGSVRSLLVDPPWARGSEEDEQPALLEVLPDDLVLLCSDGFSSIVEERVMVELAVRYGGDLEALVRRCVEAALQAGGNDNVTVVALRLISYKDR